MKEIEVLEHHLKRREAVWRELRKCDRFTLIMLPKGKRNEPGTTPGSFAYSLIFV